MSDVLTVQAIRARLARGFPGARLTVRLTQAKEDVATLLRLLEREQRCTDNLLTCIVTLTNRPRPLVP